MKAPGGGAPDVPPADEVWHPIAGRWYASLVQSGQSQFYEASDWATALYLAEAMSPNLNSGKFSAQLLQAVLSGMTDLLTTEVPGDGLAWSWSVKAAQTTRERPPA
ncbi:MULTISPECIES: hypothetical protein [Streptomyces]|uniref:phage terminase small subunit n=1 Tax=Streptomyces TaxID=1883 RepID=UPI003441FF2C